LEHLQQLMDETVAALRDGQCARAIALVDQLLMARPDESLFLCWRAWAFLGEGKKAEAWQDATRAFEHAGDEWKDYFLLALISAALNRKQQTHAAFQKAVELSNQELQTVEEYVTWQSSECAPKLAEAAAREALTRHPESARCWTALGHALDRQHRLTEAESCFKRALDLDPSSAQSQSLMTEFLILRGRDAEGASLAKIMEDGPLRDYALRAQKIVARRQALQKAFESEEYRQAARYKPNLKKEIWRGAALTIGITLYCLLAIWAVTVGMNVLLILPLVLLVWWWLRK
jgi:Flp pilus assembly protein TadD